VGAKQLIFNVSQTQSIVKKGKKAITQPQKKLNTSFGVG